MTSFLKAFDVCRIHCPISSNTASFYFPLMTAGAVVEMVVGSLREEGSGKERGSEEGGSRGAECRGEPSRGRGEAERKLGPPKNPPRASPNG